MSFSAKRLGWIDGRGTPGRNQARGRRHRQEQERTESERETIERPYAEENRAHRPCGQDGTGRPDRKAAHSDDEPLLKHQPHESSA